MNSCTPEIRSLGVHSAFERLLGILENNLQAASSIVNNAVQTELLNNYLDHPGKCIATIISEHNKHHHRIASPQITPLREFTAQAAACETLEVILRITRPWTTALTKGLTILLVLC